ncbi:sce7726 family protein [Oenococcus sp.]|uniref:sce7726 family protein n=1 Tax=Oenococcus sp. TaxID=1979414 RepID=UPI0039E94E94
MDLDILLNNFFTRPSFRRIISENKLNQYHHLVSKINLDVSDSSNNLNVIDSIYKYMGKKHRNEYFYKNDLLNKIVLGHHSINTSVALRELPISKSIADFIVINGVAKVYEIKTKLDNLDRLESQLQDYYKVFDLVYVVTDESHLSGVIEIGKGLPIGIYTLSEANTLRTVREARSYQTLFDHEAMFKVLRKKEYETIIKNVYGELPRVSDFEYFRECFKWFSQIDLADCHDRLVKLLKARITIKKHKDAFLRVPVSLREIVYFSEYTESDYSRLHDFLESKF